MYNNLQDLCHNVQNNTDGREFCRCTQCLCPDGLTTLPGRNICIPQVRREGGRDRGREGRREGGIEGGRDREEGGLRVVISVAVFNVHVLIVIFVCAEC